MSEHQRLDALGLLCPMPVIRTQSTVSALAPGTVLEVLATDPGALHDIAAWCRVHGHAYLDDRNCPACEASDRQHFHIRLRVCA
ncbi:MAG: sulfurtransferase TusA family protein [Pseudomonadota bacterium]